MGRYAASLRAFGKVFGNRQVRNVQLAGVGSTLGTWAYAVALPVYAYHSGGARAVGLLFFARFVLAALAAPWLGVLADRWSRRQLMLSADLIRCAIIAGMTAVASAEAVLTSSTSSRSRRRSFPARTRLRRPRSCRRSSTRPMS